MKKPDPSRPWNPTCEELRLALEAMRAQGFHVWTILMRRWEEHENAPEWVGGLIEEVRHALDSMMPLVGREPECFEN